MARPARNIRAAKRNAPARLRQHSGKRADQSRFAGAVGADDGDDGALLNFQRYRIERLDIAVEHIEVFDAQDHIASTPR